jgi:hypothetical protein
MLTLGGFVADHYADLLRERKDTPCSEQEQRGEFEPLREFAGPEPKAGRR